MGRPGPGHGRELDVAVFTNLTRDHLDYHQDHGEVFRGQRLLFDGTIYQRRDVAVINANGCAG